MQPRAIAKIDPAKRASACMHGGCNCGAESTITTKALCAWKWGRAEAAMSAAAPASARYRPLRLLPR